MLERMGVALVDPERCLRLSFSIFNRGSSTQKAYETLLLKVFFISVILFSGEHDVRRTWFMPICKVSF
jgi:hypothetical protein